VSAAEHTGPQGQETGRSPQPDPLAMSPGEKVAAEWEARHDVAARDSRGSAAAVQHYLAESRTHEAVAAEDTPSAGPEVPATEGRPRSSRSCRTTLPLRLSGGKVLL
jgi:hypothetical protein